MTKSWADMNQAERKAYINHSEATGGGNRRSMVDRMVDLLRQHGPLSTEEICTILGTKQRSFSPQMSRQRDKANAAGICKVRAPDKRQTIWYLSNGTEAVVPVDDVDAASIFNEPPEPEPEPIPENAVRRSPWEMLQNG